MPKQPKAATPELETLAFESVTAFEKWLEKHHDTSPGFWLKISKKGSGIDSVSYAEALDVALCFGWIDSQKKGLDEKWFLQKFGPRKSKSIWSKINQEKVAALIEDGKMRAAGHQAIETAKTNGQWDLAYDSPSNATVPEDLQKAFDENAEAAAFFAGLNGSNRFAVLFRVQTAGSPEIRTKRIKTLVEMLARGEKFHP